MRKKLLFTVLLMLALFAMPVKVKASEGDFLNGKDIKIGVEPSTPSADVVPKQYPNAQIVNESSAQQGFLDVQSGKIDAFCGDSESMDIAIKEGLGGVRILKDTPVGEPAQVAVGISPKTGIDDAKGNIDRFLQEMKQTGVIDGMLKRWVEDGDQTMPDIEKPAHPDKKIIVGTTGLLEPFSFYKDQELTGFDIELARRFALWMNADLELRTYNWEGLIPSGQTGRVDYIMSNLFKTEERAQHIDFSDSVYQLTYYLMVKDTGTGQENAEGKKELLTLDDFNGKKVGVITGTVLDQTLKNRIPQAVPVYFNNNSDMIQASETGKIDGFLMDQPVGISMIREHGNFAYLKEKLKTDDNAFVFQNSENGKKLCDAFSAFLKKKKADGSLEKLEKKWLEGSEEEQTMDEPDSLPAENGTISFGTNCTLDGFDFVRDGKYVGYEIELAVLFCRENGYGLKITDSDFIGLIPGIAAGKYDMAAAAISVTEERKKSVLFSEPDYDGGVLMMCPAEKLYGGKSAKTDKSWFESVKDSIEKNFVRENRWLLIVNGLLVTLLISALAAIFGSLLGMGICFMSLSEKKFSRVFARTYISIIQGVPIVVLLMILYYLVFAGVDINATAVAVMGFSLNFAAYVAEIVRTGIGAVSTGQMEASLSLGYPKNKAFWKFVFPQAAQHFLPVYKGEFISMVKMTSIVGYIAVQDLTKASDIIRSRTYEAFFPLITTALIYFAASWLMTRLLRNVEIRIDPKRRKRKIEGVTEGGVRA